MKRFLRTMVAFVMVLSLCTACAKPAAPSSSAAADPSQPPASSSETKSTASSSDKKIRVGVSCVVLTEFFVDQMAAFEKYAAESNIEIVGKYDANFDVQKQMEHISTFVSMGVDAILISPVDTTIAPQLISMANGIPMIFSNRPPDFSVLDGKKYCYVGSTETDAGHFQGEVIAELMKAKGKTECNYIMLIGDLGAQNAQERTAGAVAALEESGLKLNKVFEDAAGWDRTQALNKVQQVIGSGVQIDCVIANNDEMALGAIEALKAAGKLADVPVAGLDGTKNALISVKNGEMAMTVLQNADTQAKLAIEAVKLALDGQPLEQAYWCPFEKITPENVDDYLK